MFCRRSAAWPCLVLFSAASASASASTATSTPAPFHGHASTTPISGQFGCSVWSTRKGAVAKPPPRLCLCTWTGWRRCTRQLLTTHSAP
jgi:hypothetical protein